MRAGSVFFPCYHFPVRWRRAGNVWYRTSVSRDGDIPAPHTARHLRDFFLQTGMPFVVVEETETKVEAYTDPVRSIPLFYARTDDGWMLSDSAVMLARRMGRNRCRKGLTLEWRYLACTLNERTLLPGVCQLLPYQGLFLDKRSGHLAVKSLPGPFEKAAATHSREEWDRRFRQLMEWLGQQMTALAGGRPMVVPLSGGKDSRLILALLKIAGAGPLHAYTYGAADSPEVAVARRVAAALGVPWHFVEYRPETFRRYLSPRGLQYDRFASQYAGLAHEQDFFALWALKERRAIPSDAVIVSGMCTDAQNGSRIAFSSSYPRDAAALAQWIAGVFFPPEAVDNALIGRIRRGLPAGPFRTYTHALNAYEGWRTAHRLSKFSMTTMRAFEFWDWQWLAPFWTHPVVDFWQQMPYALRRDRRFFHAVVRRHFFKPLGIDVRSPLEVPSWVARLKRPLRAVPFLRRWRKRRRAVDPNALWDFADMLREDAGLPPDDYGDENEVHALWFLRRQCPPL